MCNTCCHHELMANTVSPHITPPRPFIRHPCSQPTDDPRTQPPRNRPHPSPSPHSPAPAQPAQSLALSQPAQENLPIALSPALIRLPARPLHYFILHSPFVSPPVVLIVIVARCVHVVMASSMSLPAPRRRRPTKHDRHPRLAQGAPRRVPSQRRVGRVCSRSWLFFRSGLT